MTFGRWLLVHSFSIFLVGMLLLGYLYREELRLEQAYQQLLNLDSHRAALDSISGREASAESAEPSPVLTAQPKVAISEPSVTTMSRPPAMLEQEAGSAEAAPVNTPPQQNTESVPTFVSDPLDVVGNDLLMAARQAFWEEDYPRAVSQYRRLIGADPDNPDLHGELGNIYFAMNDGRQASQEYYRAAQILMQQNRFEAAQRLLSPIRAMDRELAFRLEQELVSSGPRS